jgi:hypothetical protein
LRKARAPSCRRHALAAHDLRGGRQTRRIGVENRRNVLQQYFVRGILAGSVKG